MTRLLGAALGTLHALAVGRAPRGGGGGGRRGRRRRRDAGGDSIALKRAEKGLQSKFATSICITSEKEHSLYCFGPIFTKEISILNQ